MKKFINTIIIGLVLATSNYAATPKDITDIVAFENWVFEQLLSQNIPLYPNDFALALAVTYEKYWQVLSDFGLDQF